MGKVVQLFDRLVNLASGLGTNKDKLVSNSFSFVPLDQSQLEAMYRSDWLSRKIIDIIPLDMTREWRSWRTKKNNIEKLEAEELRLAVRHKIFCALTKARLYGGSIIYMGIDGQRPDSPLSLDSVKTGSLMYLHVLTRWEVTPGELDLDPLSYYYGQPKFYTVTNKLGQETNLHRSRVIRFIGAELPRVDIDSGEGWGDSILQIVYDAVSAASLVHQTAASLVPEAKLDVINVPGLSEILSTTEGTSKLISRFSTAGSLKSSQNMLLLQGGSEDEKESWSQKQIEFTQLTDLLIANLQVAAGSADIPITRLLGQSPAGLNATGESDTRNYYDNIRARQHCDLRYGLDVLDEVLIRSALGRRLSDVYYEFNPLWQMSDTEKSTINKQNAEATKIYVDANVVPRDVMGVAVQNQLIESGSYPGIETAYEEFSAGSLKPVKLDEIVKPPVPVLPKPGGTNAPAVI